MKTKFTPGPWHVGMNQAHRIIYDATGWAVADATVYHGKESREEMLANAALIAAAPELLAALVAMLEAFDCSMYQDQFDIGSDEDRAIISAQQALAKSRGE